MKIFRLMRAAFLLVTTAVQATVVPSLQELTLRFIQEHQPQKLIGNPLLGNWDEDTEELLAYTFGLCLAQAQNSPFIVGSSVFIDEFKLKDRIRLILGNESDFFCTFEPLLQVESASHLSRVFETRKKIAENISENNFTLLSFDVAILRSVVKGIELSDGDFFYIPTNLLDPILSLANRPNVAKLMQREIGLVLKHLEQTLADTHYPQALVCYKTILNYLLCTSDLAVKAALAKLVTLFYKPNMEVMLVTRMILRSNEALLALLESKLSEHEKSLLDTAFSDFQQRYNLHVSYMTPFSATVESNFFTNELYFSGARYFLHALLQNAHELKWVTNEFMARNWMRVSELNVSGRVLCITSNTKPPSSLAKQLINSKKVQDLKIDHWMLLAYGISVFEFSL